ncbi:CRISPR-associated protein, Cse1 family [Mycobacteroides abscessus subsp. abscessus]|nr:CRISPR-associated protein, Cse1 family [Mycobacteroides abscessus subsp. abscessus]
MIVRRLGTEYIAAAGDVAWVGRPVREKWLDSSIAERWFYKKLRAVLPSAFTEHRDTQEKEPTDGERVAVVW